ncbi:HetZ-related protein 2 [Microcoleus sp. FACHB-68]|uniref:HetZ-related protein 2 n=1 Tax=Microcoleus sp. FACHB-68 TaxID=2692826 RepID=UPI001681CAB7|nr:HetZ-related protein 2 [Microcoleus sp. FACHB-68]MBD1938298.1 HetZ-related protein 2 [Microcoleus sp. FACHB-68]
MKLAEQIAQDWRLRLANDCPNYATSTHESIICWLVGENVARFEILTLPELALAQQAMDFRYRILRQRYLGVTPAQAYRHLIQRLGSLVLLRQKIRTWVALSRDRQRSVVDVVQEVIQEMLQGDRYMQQQISWIAQCTQEARLRNALVLATTEEYCMRPVRNQPLLVYRFVNYLRRCQRGGLTQVPADELIRLVSEEVSPSDTEGSISLLDVQASVQHQEVQAWEEQHLLRTSVQREFETYLAENVGPMGVQWLRLYLQGRSQDAIAQELKLPVKQVYRLREKISYHAIRVFALKIQPELVASWLETSLSEHSLGLTSAQWQQYLNSLTAVQRQLLELLKAGDSIHAIAEALKLKPNQVIGEWTKLYIAAQMLRNVS